MEVEDKLIVRGKWFLQGWLFRGALVAGNCRMVDKLIKTLIKTS